MCFNSTVWAFDKTDYKFHTYDVGIFSYTLHPCWTRLYISVKRRWQFSEIVYHEIGGGPIFAYYKTKRKNIVGNISGQNFVWIYLLCIIESCIYIMCQFYNPEVKFNSIWKLIDLIIYLNVHIKWMRNKKIRLHDFNYSESTGHRVDLCFLIFL